MQTIQPSVADLCAKFQILMVLGSLIPHLGTDKCEIWHRAASPLPNFMSLVQRITPMG